MRPAIPTRRFRWRLTVAFVLVAAGSAGVLAVGSFVVVRQHRESAALERSMQEARLNLTIAEQTLPSPPSAEDITELIAAFRRRGGFHAVIRSAGATFSSHVSIGMREIPGELRAVVRSGGFGEAQTAVGVAPYLVLGGPVDEGEAEAYFFFSKRRLQQSLSELATVLVVSWLVVVMLAALIGSFLARRTLQPVADASRAARSLAEGLLDTRLPVRTEDEFGVLAASFNEMAQALETKLNELSAARERERRFTSDVAHELRTPLTALVNEASLLREHLDEIPRSARRPAELLVHDVTRLRELVLDIMEISRLDSDGKASLQLEETDVGVLVASVLARNDWTSAVQVEGDGVLVTDRRRLDRVVRNLLGNALEHGGEPVRVSIRSEGGTLVVEVRDAGPGIAPEHLPHVFERFYKADAARSGAGSGLGLAIALENAKLLGGDIEVSSRPGDTRFTFRTAS